MQIYTTTTHQRENGESKKKDDDLLPPPQEKQTKKQRKWEKLLDDTWPPLEWMKEMDGIHNKTTSRQLPYLEVGVPDSVAYLNLTPIFEWWFGLVRFQERILKDMCLKEIELRAVDI